MKYIARRIRNPSLGPMAGRLGNREAQSLSNLDNKFARLYIQTQGLFVSHLLCTQIIPKSSLLPLLQKPIDQTSLRIMDRFFIIEKWINFI